MLVHEVHLAWIFTLISLLGLSRPKENIPVTHEIPINIAQNVLFITLTINDSSANFVLDTGATVSLLDEKQAPGYHFVCHTSQGKGKINGLAGVNTLQLATGIRASHGGFKFKGFKFYSCNLDSLHEFFKKRNIFILGIIGADFLIKHNAIIDYKNKRLVLQKG